MAFSATPIAARTSASVSTFCRSSSSVLVAGVPLAPSAVAASRRLAFSVLPSNMAKRTWPSDRLMAGTVSAA